MPLKPALAVRGTVAGRRLGAERGRGVTPPPLFHYIPEGSPRRQGGCSHFDPSLSPPPHMLTPAATRHLGHKAEASTVTTWLWSKPRLPPCPFLQGQCPPDIPPPPARPPRKALRAPRWCGPAGGRPAEPDFLGGPLPSPSPGPPQPAPTGMSSAPWSSVGPTGCTAAT